ncbi:SinI family autotransporter-associated protein [Yersinia frederiksenii]|uniref:SinI family autotransporter-associated protein n=1 Tax=Yersinia frederiksenii TaxID=29484 RepID=UPI0005DDDD9A|nr:SinI family autotransporter-associated protein [Yersinia frederiksenii]CQJ05544.1 intimin-like protein SinH [Yersinia frederiksenii]
MKSKNSMTPIHCALRQIALVLILSSCTTGVVWAGSTETTVALAGTAPILEAPSNNAKHAVDFSGTYARSDVMSTGDTVVLTYHYVDSDGDEDDSLSTVVWSYTPVGGGADMTIIPVSNVPAVGNTPGTSTIKIPDGAVGAATIKVELWEQSKTGIPSRGAQSINVIDISKGGGGTPSLPGPIALNASVGITGGIFLAIASPTAGSGALDYSRTTNNQPKVGETYKFRAWRDTNGNGVWDAGEEDVTSHLSSIQWMLDGNNTSAAGKSSPVTLSDHAIPGATTDSYTVPVNSASGSGAVPGDQGFSLKVSFE